MCYHFINKTEINTDKNNFIRGGYPFWYLSCIETDSNIWLTTYTQLISSALRIILGTDCISYANALNVCDVDRLSARREQHSVKFAQSLPKCSQTSKLLPPCRGEIHGRQLRNNAKLTQPCGCAKRYACSPIPYYVELTNSKLPLLDFLLSIFFFARLLYSLALFLCCLLLYF